jgi:DNA/RNA-binding domain of Phe-tRNA-synthetase-like protein
MAALTLSIREVSGAFRAFRVAVALLRGLEQGERASAGIAAFVSAAEADALALLADRAPADLPEIQAWRAAYRAFGSKKTSYRNSCEALLRRLGQEGKLPRVLPLVDLYNALSVKYRIPVGADDLAKLVPSLAFRPARPGDSFFDLASEPPRDDPPPPGEIVYADAEKCLCRRWNWRQDARSRVTAETRDAVVVLQTLEADGAERLSAAAEDLAREAAAHLGASCRWAIASAEMPEVGLELD